MTAIAFGRVVAACLVAVVEIAGAKTYRCGNVFQATPCPPPAASAVAAPKRPCAMTDSEWDRAARRERAFLARFTDAAAHRAAHRAAIEPVVAGLRPMQERLAFLLRERREIDKEKEFYVGKALPRWLAAKDDAIDAQLAGLAEALGRAEESIRAIDARRRCEIETYGPLWSDAPIGISACKRPPCLAD